VLAFVPKHIAEHFEIGLLAPVFANWTVGAVFMGCVGIIAVSSTTRPDAPLEPLAEWIDQTGNPSVIREPIVHALGLPGGDLRVRERGFRKTGEQFTHVCSVSPRPALKNKIFFASIDEATGDALVWMADRRGQLEKSASFVNGLATRNSNNRLESAFQAEKAYFRVQLRDQIYRTRPASPPPTPAYDVTTRVLSGDHRATTLSSEAILLFSNPWVIPAIGLVLAAASQRRPKSR
jgi:hypothetical protein